MQVCGREFGPQLLQRIQQTVDQEPDLSRRALSRLVCEWLNWRTALHELKEVSCRVALLKLHRRGALDLPAVAPAVVSPPRPLPARRAPQPIVVTEASLEALQPVSLRRIEQADCAASRLWNQMMERYHYLGAGPLCGAQMRYAVHSRQGEWLGGLAFSGAAWPCTKSPTTGKNATAIGPCWWKPLWRRSVLQAPAIGPPTGGRWGRRWGEGVRTGSTAGAER